MPPKKFQFGYDHYLYLPSQGTQPQVLSEITTDLTDGVNAIDWGSDYTIVRDLSFSGAPNTIDVTTRGEARQGVQAQAIVTTARTLEFQIRYQPSIGGTVEYHMAQLVNADLTGSEIALMELDGSLDGDTPTFGFAGNFTVSTTFSKPLQDLVVVDVTATASTHFHAVVSSGQGSPSLPFLGDATVLPPLGEDYNVLFGGLQVFFAGQEVFFEGPVVTP